MTGKADTDMPVVERKRVIYKTLLVLLAAMLVLGVGCSIALTLLQGEHISTVVKDTRTNSDITKNNSDRLVDCTTPGGKCYEQSRSATSGAIGTINKVTVLAVACAKSPANNTLDKIQACVLEGLK